MDEHVLAIISPADEAVALGIVEPLHGTERHVYCLLHNVEVHLGLHVILFKHPAPGSLNQILEESARTLQTFIVMETSHTVE
jgi:hypothetical protein